MSRDDCAQVTHAAAWVLGLLDPEEAERYAAHLEHCTTCRLEVERLQRAADAMADAAPPATPPARLRARIMSTVRQEAELFRAAGAAESLPRDARPARPLARGLSLVLVAAALLGGGALIGGALSDDERLAVRTIPGSVTFAGGAPRARAAIVTRGTDAELRLSGFKTPAKDQIYQAWLVRPVSQPTPTGAYFSVGPTGATAISLPSLRGVERLIVTAERRGGSRTPTPPPVVTVRLPVQP